MFALDRNPQAQNQSFGVCRHFSRKARRLQVSLYETVTGKNFEPDFRLTGEPLGNKIQLQSFGGCDSVEADSPIEHHPGRTGEKCSPFGVSICILEQTLGLG
ncbi:MAG: hypothetical protein ABSH40_15710 [Bryobacteraceae bacterium]